MKKCKKCKLDKELSEFYKNNKSKDGHKTICIKCHKICQEERKNRKKIIISEKICCICKKKLNISEFSNMSRAIDGKSGSCKKCQNKASKISSQKNWIPGLICDSKKKDKKYNFDISKLITKKFIENQLKLQKNKCYYCECEMKYGIGVNRKGGEGLTLERIDSKQGHTKENCVLICHECNIMKSNMNFRKFIEKCLKIGKKFQYIINS